MRARHKTIQDEQPADSPKELAEGSSSPTEERSPSENLEAEIETLKAEQQELQGQLLRTLADMQNMRKRFLQDQEQTKRFATEELVRELLPVLDNFERTIIAAEQGASIDTVLDGVKAVDRQLRTALERQRVTRIKAHGEPFDPDLHEAIATDESHEHEEGTVTGEIEPGYKMGEKVIRPARVRVARKP